MALTSAGFGMSVTFLDNGSNIAVREYAMDTTRVTTYALAETAALSMLADLVPLSDAVVSSYRIFAVFNETVLVIPSAGVQVENQASLTSLLTSPGNKKANLNIPAIKQSVFVGSSGPQANDVNMSNALILAFLGNFFAVEDFTVSDGEKIARGLDGKRVHKKSSRG